MAILYYPNSNQGIQVDLFFRPDMTLSQQSGGKTYASDAYNIDISKQLFDVVTKNKRSQKLRLLSQKFNHLCCLVLTQRLKMTTNT